MKYLICLLILTSFHLQAKECQYPAAPINWIMRYCANVVETGDEIIIQESACYKTSEIDMKSKDTCATNKKYKTLICNKFHMQNKKYKTIDNCLKDASIEPFFAGG